MFYRYNFLDYNKYFEYETQCLLECLPVLLVLAEFLRFCLLFGTSGLTIGLAIDAAESTRFEVVVGLSG